MYIEAAVQRTPTGQLLGLCLAIPAEVVEDYADRESIKFEVIPTNDGFMLMVAE